MLFSTFIKAISPITGELLLYSGQNIESISKECARQYCEIYSRRKIRMPYGCLSLKSIYENNTALMC